jgi:hypothetical protein
VLTLRRGIVIEADPLTVRVDGQARRAWADRSLIGEVAEGDEVIVNTEAVDLGLGSGGFDVVHVNLTRGLEGGEAPAGQHLMKLNYTSLQHSVAPLEGPGAGRRGADESASAPPALVLPLHGHLAPAAWAASRALPGLRLGYVQTAGGALPGSLSRDVAELREHGLLAGHVTAGPAYGAEHEAISTVGALDSAHAALVLGMPTLVSPRLSGSDPRSRHRGLSHHTATVLELLLGSVGVPVPEIDLAGWPTGEQGTGRVALPSALDALHEVCDERHDVIVEPVDLEGYAASGLPTQTMGRTIDQDPLFFAAALAAGSALAGAAAVGG